MRFSRIIACISASCVLAGAVSAQSLDTDFRINPERAAGVYHSYEFVPIADTPAPKGFKPFYVSHYGRHGSRHQIGSSGTLAYEAWAAAEKAGLLTEAGERMMKDIRRVYEEHVGMDGELTRRGGLEHQQIASRMFNRFPQAFKDRRRTAVHCQASIIPRCLVSMAYFTTGLKDASPRLQFDFITGQKYLDLLARDYYDTESYRERQSAIRDSILLATVHPDHFIDTYFKKDPSRGEVLPNPHKLLWYTFLYVSICQDLREELDGLDMFHWLTPQEILEMGIYSNDRTYSSFGNSLEFGDHITWAAKWLVEDFIERADKALEKGSDTAADLRFGHDSGILPLAGLLGLEGIGDRWSIGQAHLHYPVWQNIPMGSNLQMVFYRNRKDDILVKILYNEKETAIPAVPAFEGPYYKWQDLRAYLVSISENKEFQK